MDHITDPLLPAFYMLWKAAMNEPLRITDQDCVNANKGPTNFNTNQQANPANRQLNRHHHQNNDPNNWHNGESPIQMHSEHFHRKPTRPGEGVVVCTVECDQGSKFVKQIFHESPQRTVWSSVEDLFVDWLNCDVTSQRAEQVDVTVYLCRIPMSTTSDGIRLWMENLRLEGKEVNLRMKVASLDPLVPEEKDANPEAGRKRKTSIQEDETEDTVRSLKHLIKRGAHIEPISTGDWMQLMTLLTDRASLQALDLRRSPCSGIMSAVLHS